MDSTLDAIFFAVAIVLFVVAAFGPQVAARVNLVALGLALVSAGLLVGGTIDRRIG